MVNGAPGERPFFIFREGCAPRKTKHSQDSPTPETGENGSHDTDNPYFLSGRSFDGTASHTNPATTNCP